jgi:hypothetical protein
VRSRCGPDRRRAKVARARPERPEEIRVDVFPPLNPWTGRDRDAVRDQPAPARSRAPGRRTPSRSGAVATPRARALRDAPRDLAFQNRVLPRTEGRRRSVPQTLLPVRPAIITRPCATAGPSTWTRCARAYRSSLPSASGSPRSSSPAPQWPALPSILSVARNPAFAFRNARTRHAFQMPARIIRIAPHRAVDRVVRRRTMWTASKSARSFRAVAQIGDAESSPQPREETRCSVRATAVVGSSDHPELVATSLMPLGRGRKELPLDAEPPRFSAEIPTRDETTRRVYPGQRALTPVCAPMIRCITPHV